MKKLSIISCFSDGRGSLELQVTYGEDPGKVYMPDMAYSRAYETYAPLDTLA